ncbi:SDR family NAD(P)-dependent oxidoreductase [archaeon]|nr:MAG: SDR family NAD(P)-dependent oxidoreductase [archaeon]
MNWILSIPRLIAGNFQGGTPSCPIRPHSLDGKCAIITGGNSGIGFETSLALAVQGCEVYILCRNPTKAQEAVNTINEQCQQQHSQGSCTAMSLDLSDLDSVQICAAEIRKLFYAKTIDYFICNGGICMQPYSTSKQGYEIHFATNHLGHFALVGLLIDILRKYHSKVVVLTGDIAILEDDASPDFVYHDGGLDAYCRSKICNQSFAKMLHSKYGTEIIVYSVHPGVVDTNLLVATNQFDKLVKSIFMIDCKRGAQSTLLCCVSDVVPRGSYFHNVFGVTDYHPTVLKEGWNENMWTLSEGLCVDAGLTLMY